MSRTVTAQQVRAPGAENRADALAQSTGAVTQSLIEAVDRVRAIRDALYGEPEKSGPEDSRVPEAFPSAVFPRLEHIVGNQQNLVHLLHVLLTDIEAGLPRGPARVATDTRPGR